MRTPEAKEVAADLIGHFIKGWWDEAQKNSEVLDSSDWILAFMTMTGMIVDMSCKDRNTAEAFTKMITDHMNEGIMRFYDQSNRTLN